MPEVWHPKRWWNVCMSEDEKKEIEPLDQQCTIWKYWGFWLQKIIHEDLI